MTNRKPSETKLTKETVPATNETADETTETSTPKKVLPKVVAQRTSDVKSEIETAKVEKDTEPEDFNQNLVFHPEPSPELIRQREAKDAVRDLSEDEQKALRGQHPALVGEDELEVARRCPDQHDKRSNKYRKVFVVQGRSFADEEWFHRAQFNALRQEAVNSGVRLTEDPHFVGAEPHGDGVSLNLVYEAEAVPAVSVLGLGGRAQDSIREHNEGVTAQQAA